MRVRRTITFAIAALALAAAPMATTSPAAAAENLSVSVTSGNIAFGYSDGYWDQTHQWHRWHGRDEAQAWRQHNAAHYYDRRHDADKDAGWRGSDRWWNHH